ncbi:hypothetical protein [Mycolicibacterium holsaticum]|uniref:hypothetical protein n=1 Tax=Mycolicibacterium holsaticum TaxID=152142 RepID=UPI000DA127C5|nr:hypothetical protein [Mycolicibacterium holsaticum]
MTALTRRLGVIGAMAPVAAIAVAELSDLTGYTGGRWSTEAVWGTARTPAAITTVAMDLCGEKLIAGPPSASHELG